MVTNTLPNKDVALVSPCTFFYSVLRCDRCLRAEIVRHPTGDQFFCCRQTMRKETVYR